MNLKDNMERYMGELRCREGKREFQLYYNLKTKNK